MTSGGRDALPLIEVVRQNVRRLRRRRGLTANQLAGRLQTLGSSLDKNVLASFESGRRKTLNAWEVMELAIALEVSPAQLMFPPEGYELAVGSVVVARGDADAWLRGLAWPTERTEAGGQVEFVSVAMLQESLEARLAEMKARYPDGLTLGEIERLEGEAGT